MSGGSELPCRAEVWAGESPGVRDGEETGDEGFDTPPSPLPDPVLLELPAPPELPVPAFPELAAPAFEVPLEEVSGQRDMPFDDWPEVLQCPLLWESSRCELLPCEPLSPEPPPRGSTCDWPSSVVVGRGPEVVVVVEAGLVVVVVVVLVVEVVVVVLVDVDVVELGGWFERGGGLEDGGADTCGSEG